MRYLFGAIASVAILYCDLSAQKSFTTAEIENAKIELGRRLFYEADLSINGTMSCATCHEQKHAFTDTNAMHPGALGDPAKRNVPALANIAEFKNLTWADNSLSGLAEQAHAPIKGTNPIEMGMNGYEGEITKRLSQSECYKKLFKISFPKRSGAIDLDSVTHALESFQKTLISKNSIYDKSIKNKTLLPTKSAQIGKELFFGSANCNSCHSAPLFSDDSFHIIESNYSTDSDLGLYEITKNSSDKYKFRTPSLRNVSLTAPYWHNGSVKSLRDAIIKHDIKEIKNLSSIEIGHIISFLHALQDDSFITNPNFSKPPKECPY